MKGKVNWNEEVLEESNELSESIKVGSDLEHSGHNGPEVMALIEPKIGEKDQDSFGLIEAIEMDVFVESNQGLVLISHSSGV